MWNYLEYIILQIIVIYLFWLVYFSGKSKLNIGNKIRSFIPFVLLEIFILYNLINGKSILDWIVELHR